MSFYAKPDGDKLLQSAGNLLSSWQYCVRTRLHGV